MNQPQVIQLYNINMGGVDLSDQRVTTYAHLMKEVVLYYKLFFYHLELSVSNAQILMTKSQFHNNVPAMLGFRKSLIAEFINGKSFRRYVKIPQPVILPHLQFNRDYFYYSMFKE